MLCLILSSLSISTYPLSERQKKIALGVTAVVAAGAGVYAGYHIIKTYSEQSSSRLSITLDNGVTVYQSLAQKIQNREWKYTFTPPADKKNVPFITDAQFGKTILSYRGDLCQFPGLELDKDLLLYSQASEKGSVDSWKWNKISTISKQTNHSNGIQADEISSRHNWLNDDERQSLEAIILTMGVENALRTDARQDTLHSYLSSAEFTTLFPNAKTVYVLPSPEAAELYNTLAAQGKHVLMFYHATC